MPKLSCFTIPTSQNGHRFIQFEFISERGTMSDHDHHAHMGHGDAVTTAAPHVHDTATAEHSAHGMNHGMEGMMKVRFWVTWVP